MTWKDNVIMRWDAEKISDHNRSPLAIDVQRIERSARMVDGTMRKYVVGQKRTFSCSWENLPSVSNVTSGPVDAGLSGTEMQQFSDSSDTPFTLTLADGQTNEETFLVYLQEFSYEIVKRGATVDLWNVNVTLEEV